MIDPPDHQGNRAATAYTYTNQKLLVVDYLASPGGQSIERLNMSYGEMQGFSGDGNVDYYPTLVGIQTTANGRSKLKTMAHEKVGFYADFQDCSSSQSAVQMCETSSSNQGQTLVSSATPVYTYLPNVTAIHEYDWGPEASVNTNASCRPGSGCPALTPSGALLRQTFRTPLYSKNAGYLYTERTQNPNSVDGDPIQNRRSYRNITALMVLEGIYDGSSVCSDDGYLDESGTYHARTPCNANRVAETTTVYDNDQPANSKYRALPATISRWLGGSDYVSTGYGYDAQNNLQTIRDARGFSTTISYSNSWALASAGNCAAGMQDNLFPTTVTNALNQSRYYIYSACTGARTGNSDDNDRTAGRSGTTTHYDLMGRADSVTAPDGGSVTIQFNDQALTSETKKVLSSTATLVQDHSMDGFSRTTGTQITSDPSGTVRVDSQYDPAGRLYFQSDPYRGSAASLGTAYTYDALSRVTSATHTADQTRIETQYIANQTKTTDESGSTWTRTVDGLDRLTSIVEPGGLLSIYGYDVLGDLTQVTQNGSGNEVARSHSFTYDSLSRLLTSSNPETGMICYGTTSNQVPTSTNCRSDGYDPNGNLICRTDANGKVTSYQYDALNRLTFKTYSDGTPLASFGYDGHAEHGETIPQSTNAIGRMSTSSDEAHPAIL